MVQNPKDRGTDGARIIDLDSVRRAKFAENMKNDQAMQESMNRHPAFRAKQKREEEKND